MHLHHFASDINTFFCCAAALVRTSERKRENIFGFFQFAQQQIDIEPKTKDVIEIENPWYTNWYKSMVWNAIAGREIYIYIYICRRK